MNSYRYEVSPGEAINIWKYSPIKLEKIVSEDDIIEAQVNTGEGYLEIEYPVRRDFLLSLVDSDQIKKGEPKFTQLYAGLESPRVDFSTFISTPHKISTTLQAFFNVSETANYSFSLVTCGRALVWVNDELNVDFRPYTRNKGSQTIIELPLKKGSNKVTIYMDDLAERDINYFLELHLLSKTSIAVELPLNYKGEELSKSLKFLSGLYLEKDFFETGDIIVYSDCDTVDQIYVSYDEVFLPEKIEGDGNITDFERKDRYITVKEKQIYIGNTKTLKTSGLTKMYIVVELPDQTTIYKKLVFSVHDKSMIHSYDSSTLEERKKEALRLFANLDIPDMNSALASYYLEDDYNRKTEEKLARAYTMIENHGDCADFMFAPLLAFLTTDNQKLPTEVSDKIKNLALSFRYWIDEPGNDVMWYFSENHSLLFHICQYLAGYLLPEEKFEVSGRTGDEQYEIGKERLYDWFNQFELYGFSEWNSATYLPIDLIGFFSLYLAAPDPEMKVLAERALDYTFKFIAINHHGGTMASTFGRTYEHDLKAMRLGEISNILEIAWKKGYANYAIRAATLFCLSDYEPPIEYLNYLELDSNQVLTANYLQGINHVETYLYKTRPYSIASAVRYKAREQGHQQHMMNVSLGDDVTLLWINNPGEHAHSGENRPSYWAGNGIFPSIHQYKNVIQLSYDLSEAKIKKIHLYLPIWQLTQVNPDYDNWLFIQKDEAYMAIYFSNGYEIEDSGATRNREVVSYGIEHQVIVKCSSENEGISFDQFVRYMVQCEINSESYQDFQFGTFTWTETALLLDGKSTASNVTFEVEPVIELLKEEVK